MRFVFFSLYNLFKIELISAQCQILKNWLGEKKKKVSAWMNVAVVAIG